MMAAPSNPTGISIPHDELAAISGYARERGGRRIADTIYPNLAVPAPLPGRTTETRRVHDNAVVPAVV
jgi:aspartate/methionine/tyrosine aminotransferase